MLLWPARFVYICHDLAASIREIILVDSSIIHTSSSGHLTWKSNITAKSIVVVWSAQPLKICMAFRLGKKWGLWVTILVEVSLQQPCKHSLWHTLLQSAMSPSNSPHGCTIENTREYHDCVDDVHREKAFTPFSFFSPLLPVLRLACSWDCWLPAKSEMYTAGKYTSFIMVPFNKPADATQSRQIQSQNDLKTL